MRFTDRIAFKNSLPDKGTATKWISLACFVIGLSFLWLPNARASTIPGEPSGKILLLADIHFDPVSESGIAKQLIDAPVAQWEGIFAPTQRTRYAGYRKDTNYALLKSTLSAAAAQGPFDFAILLGDYLRHDFFNAFVSAGGSQSQFPKFATDTAVFVVQTVQTSLGIPIYLVLGNEDSTCGDYRITPDGPFLDTVAQSMQVFDNKPEAALSFRKAGFYDLPHPIVPDEQLLLLNSVLWSTLYSNCKPDGTDLGQAELDWLTAKLQDAKALNKKVILVMHIPPGIDAHASFSDNSSTSVTNFWKGHYTEQFITLMQRYGGVVQIALAGHTHMDDFRVLAASTNGQSVPLHITPAVSSIFGNNPAFSVLRYDVHNGAILDFDGYFLNLSNDKSPEWALEYRFSAAYGYTGFTAGNLTDLAERIQRTPSVRKTFLGFYAVSAPSPITCNNWPFFCCAETQFTSPDYLTCVHNLQVPVGQNHR